MLSCFNCQVNLVVLPKIVAENPNHPGISFLSEFRLANLTSFAFEFHQCSDSESSRILAEQVPAAIIVFSFAILPAGESVRCSGSVYPSHLSSCESAKGFQEVSKPV